MDAETDDFYIDGALLLPVQTNPELPAGIPAAPPQLCSTTWIGTQCASSHVWMLYRREIDDGARYFFDGLTWVQQTKSGHLRQFGAPFDGGSPSLEHADATTVAAMASYLAAAGTSPSGFILPVAVPGYTNDIYRWNLVRDADASGNTVYYVWDDESQLLGVNSRTAGTQYLTDIYDTSNAPNPTPPVPPSPLPPCSGPPSTQSCGNCGTQSSTCVNGVWSWSDCQNEGCQPGQMQDCTVPIATAYITGTQTCDPATCTWGACQAASSSPPPPPPPTCTPSSVSCGNCGTQTTTCVNGAPVVGDCEGQGACGPGETQSCGVASSGTQTCSDSCAWGDCLGKLCPGEYDQHCGNCNTGYQWRSCNNGVWGAWGPCTGDSECSPGQTQPCGTGGTQTCGQDTCEWESCVEPTCSGAASQACGNCGTGTQTRTCSGGTWSAWGSCTGGGTCAPGASMSCGGQGTQVCSSACGWGACTCPSGMTLVNGTCQRNITGALDRVLGLFEKNASAQTAVPSVFAHHVHLTWSLPSFPAYPTNLTSTPGLFAPYTFSPIWKALPFAQLTTVNVFSATSAAPDRQLVREYQLGYTSNTTQTQSYLSSIQLVGDCDSVGAIPEAGFASFMVAGCAATEAFPPTTYTYFGIPPAGSAPSSAPAPTIVTEAPAYSAPAGADFLVDLNGDAIDDLVAGNNGAGAYDQCLAIDAQAQYGCWATNEPLAIATGGLYGQTCTCQPPAPAITGPDQTPGSAFTTSTMNGLTTYLADDNMWTLSVFADWTATGRTGFLQLFTGFPGGISWSNVGVPPTFLADFSDVASTSVPGNTGLYGATGAVTLQSLMGSLGSTNQASIADSITVNENAVPVGAVPLSWLGGGFIPANAMDADGDGIPDMALVQGLSPTEAKLLGATLGSTLFSTRDHAGATHPFQLPLSFPMSPWENPSWSWQVPWCWGPQGEWYVNPTTPHNCYQLQLGGGGSATYWSIYTGGTFTGPGGGYTAPAHAAVDFDGDGLADEVIANKFRPDWNTPMLQYYNGFQGNDPSKNQQLPSGVDWTIPASYVGLVVLPNRGDGRFGVPASDTPFDWLDSTPGSGMFSDYGNYVTPGAPVPFAPYSPQWGPLTSYYPSTGPIPPPQSDSLDSPQFSGLAMQSGAIRFGDLNGDGMADYALLDENGLHICLRYGGWWDTAHWQCVTETAFASNDQNDSTLAHPTIMIGDVNGSGINRVVFFPPAQLFTQVNGPSTNQFGPPSGPATSISVSPDGTFATEGTNFGVSAPRDGLLASISNGAGETETFSYATVNSLGIGSIPAPAWVVTSVTTTNGLSGSQAVSTQTRYAYSAPIYDARDAGFVGFRSVTVTTSSDASGSSPGLVTKTTFATQTDNTLPGVPEALIHLSFGLPLVVETSENSNVGVDGPMGRRFLTTAYTYSYQEPYASLDGRPGLSVASTTRMQFPWNAGTSSVPGSAYNAVVLASGAGTLPGVPYSIPAGARIVLSSRTFDVNGNEVLDQDDGVIARDATIVRQNTWGLPPGDATSWSYRLLSSVVGFATASGTVDTSQATREIDYSYDSLGRLIQESAPLSGGGPLLGPGGSSAYAAGQPPSAVLGPTSLILRTLQYDTNGNVVSVGSQDNPCFESINYDPLFNQLLASTTTYPGGCGTAGLSASVSIDRRIEEVTGTLDAAGRTTATRYDDFGRILEVNQPNVAIPGFTTEVLTATYSDWGPVRSVTTNTGYGLDTGASAASGFLTHVRYIDGLGETRAIVDQVDPAAYGGQLWTVSGVHTTYSNGRASTIYQPMFGGGPAAPGSLPPEVLAPTSASASVVYDGLGRSVQASDFLGSTSTATYRDGDLAVDSRDPEQLAGSHPHSLTTVTRDGHGRVKSTDMHWNRGPDDAAGNLVTTATYQPTGEPTTITQTYPGGSITRALTYDSLGRVVANFEPNAGQWQYAYDAEGHLVGASDARGCGRNLFYDLAGRLLAVNYSPCDDAQAPYTPVTIQAGTFPYPGAEESYLYDPTTGFLDASADRARSDAYAYDAAGHPSQVSRQMALPDLPGVYGATYVKYLDQYSVTSRVLDWGMNGLALASGGPITQTTTLGVDDSVLQIATSTSGVLLSNPTLNPSGRPLAMTFGQDTPQVTGLSATTASYYYDANGALSWLGIGRSFEFSVVTGQPDGPVASGTYNPPALWDPSLVTSLTSLSLQRDLVGNPTIATDSATGWPPGSEAVSQTYAYSDDYRLRAVTSTVAGRSGDPWVDPYQFEQSNGSPLYPQPSAPATGSRLQSFQATYDWRGNLATSTDDASDFFDRSLGAVTTVAGTDQIASATASGGALSTAYDAAGNLTQLVVTVGLQPAEYTYAWDEVGNLASATRTDDLGSVAETYVYAGNGERAIFGQSVTSQAAGATGGPTPPTYTVSIFDSLLLKNAAFEGDYEDDPCTEQAYFGGGLARLFYDVTGAMPQAPGANPYYAECASNAPAGGGGPGANYTFLNIRDPRASSAFVIDVGTNELVERTAYLPYGALDSDYRNPRWQGSREDLKYTGQWDNAEVGLAYYGARYYSPALGRFISPDPLTIHEVAGDPNPYEYANGNPIAYLDPSGLAGEQADTSQGNASQIPPYVCDADDDCVYQIEVHGAKRGTSDQKSSPDNGWYARSDDGDKAPGLTPAKLADGLLKATGNAAVNTVKTFFTFGLGPMIDLDSTKSPNEQLAEHYFGPAAKVNPSTPEEVRQNQQAWVTGFVMAAGTLLAPGEPAEGPAMRGPGGPPVFDPNAPLFYGVQTNGGGTRWVSTDFINIQDFAPLVKEDAQDGTIILSGTHGNEAGGLNRYKESVLGANGWSFFDDDLAKFGKTEGVKVIDVFSMTQAQFESIVEGPGTIICAWCFSESNPTTKP